MRVVRFCASLVILVAACPAVGGNLCACVPEGPRTEETFEVPSDASAEPISRFTDHFERGAIGPDYLVTGPGWTIEGGALCASGAKNHGVWLRAPLPQKVRVEFDAVARSEQGDVKVELFGDGESFAKGTSYADASGYVAIFGGWKNTVHVFARLNEHGKDRAELPVEPGAEDPRGRPVLPDQPYHFVFERRSVDLITWTVNGVTLLEYRDASPLVGDGHDHVGFNNWVAPVCFDNLEIAAL